VSSTPARARWLALILLSACAQNVNRPEDGPPMAAFPLTGKPGLRRVTVGLWKPSFSPDATKLAVGRTGGGIEVVELATGARRKLTLFGLDPAWSPDGRFIAFASGGKENEVWVIEPEGAQPRRVASGGFPSWSADGKRLFCVNDGQIFALPIDDQGAQPALFFGQVRASYPAVSPDESRVAMLVDGEVLVVDRLSGTEVSRTAVGRTGGFVAWSPDGKWVAYGFFDSSGVSLYDPATRELRTAVRGPFTIPTFSRDGKLLAFDQRLQGNNDVWITDAFNLGPRSGKGTVGRGAGVVTPPEKPSWRWRRMPMAELDLRDLGGHLWKLRDLDGKVALVNVWATWCGPCMRELPLVQQLYESVKGRADTVVLSLNVDDDPAKARQYAADHKLTFPVLPGARYVSKAIGPSVTIPRTWIVGGGLLTAESTGFREGQESAWLDGARAQLERARKK
jgi:thiol-disulfide isomerase/thioredoxin